METLDTQVSFFLYWCGLTNLDLIVDIRDCSHIILGLLNVSVAHNKSPYQLILLDFPLCLADLEEE